MSEIITGPGLLFAVGAKLINDVCGPSAKYLGKELESYTQAGVSNLRRVFAKASKRLHAHGKDGGAVPARVLKTVLLEGYFCEDEIHAEYLGGVLASSKGPVSRDDRGITYSAIISSLSSYQIRTHYLLYSCLLRATNHRWPDITKWMTRGTGITVAVENDLYIRAMEFSPHEVVDPIIEHVFTGLEKHALLKKGLEIITSERLGKKDASVPPFRYFYPTLAGIELFLWGLGVGDRGLEAYTPALLDNELPKGIDPLDVHLGEGSW